MTAHPSAFALRNAIALRRYENRVVQDVTARIDRAFDRVVQYMAAFDPTSRFPGHRQRTREALEQRVGVVFDGLYRDLKIGVSGSLVDVGTIQAEFAARQLERTVGQFGVDLTTKRLGRGFFRSLVLEDPIQGAPVAEWWADQNQRTALAFSREVRKGMAQSETVDQLVRRVRGRSVGGGRYDGGVMQVSTRQAESLVRTSVNHVATRAHEENYKVNDDVTEEYQYTATLDSRTTPICQALDGKIFRYDDPKAPRPPQHWGCRSTIVPVVNWKRLGLEPPKGGMRAAVDGPVAADTDYSGWLRDQPAAVQDDILGPSRGKLFRAGKVGLADLVRSDGSTVTLKELENAA